MAHRIDSPGATEDNLFTDGDPANAIPSTTVDAAWLNDLQENICQAIEAAGIELVKGAGTQLADAIIAMIAANSVTIGAATTTEAGIVEEATAAEVLAGEDTSRYVCPADMAAAIIGKVRAYTRQQYAAPVARTAQSGSQAVDIDLHQVLSISANGDFAMAAPTNMAVGKSMTLQVYSGSARAITWDAAYLSSAGYSLPTNATAGKWMVLSFLCHKAGFLLLTGAAEEA